MLKKGFLPTWFNLVRTNYTGSNAYYLVESSEGKDGAERARLDQDVIKNTPFHQTYLRSNAYLFESGDGKDGAERSVLGHDVGGLTRGSQHHDSARL